MNTRELYVAINNRFTSDEQREVLIELLNQLTAVTEATLEMAGERRLATGQQPLSMRNRALLRKFIDLPLEEKP